MAKYKVLRKCFRKGRLIERGEIVETDDKKVPRYFEALEAPKPKRSKRKPKAASAPVESPTKPPFADDVL